MKLQQKLLAALLAVAFTGGAHAAIDNSTTGNGSMYASVSNGTTSSAIFDLGFLLNDFLPGAYSAPGTSLTWNLATSSSAVGSTGVTNYSNVWSTFAATVTNWSTVVFDVAAADNTGTATGSDRVLSTSTTPLATANSVTNGVLGSFGGAVDPYINASNVNGTNPTVDNGAANNTSVSTTLFATAKGDMWQGSSAWDTTPFVGTGVSFYYVQNSGSTSAASLSKASVTPFGWADPTDSNNNSLTFEPGTFNLSQTGVLTYTTAAAVPEADTWAMFAAGLLVVGAIARRRMQA